MSTIVRQFCDDRSKASESFLHVCCYIITIVSIYDAFLAFYYRHYIVERNPICLWLMDLEPTYLTVFLIAKLIGTIGVVATILCLAQLRPRIAFPVAQVVTLFQIGLVFYLHFSFTY